GDQPLARDTGHEGIGGWRRHAEQGCVADELTTVDLALDELALQRGDEGMVVSGSHGVLRGSIVSAVTPPLSMLTPRNACAGSAGWMHASHGPVSGTSAACSWGGDWQGQ